MASLRPSTQKLYEYGLHRFYQWLNDSGTPNAVSVEELDEQLETYALSVFNTNGGRGRSTVAKAIYGVVWLNPHLKGRLVRATLAINQKGWARVSGRQPRRHPPLTWPLVCFLASRLCASSRADTAAAMLLSFDCLLRVSEAANLKVSDICDTALVDSRIVSNTGLLVRLGNPKTSDGDQSVPVLSPAVAGFIREWLADRQRKVGTSGLLFGRKWWQLRRDLQIAAQLLNTGVKFTWHSLRHGGATYLYMSGWSVPDIMRHGRWRDQVSAFHYFQSGMATAAAHGVSPDTIAIGERVSTVLSELYSR